METKKVDKYQVENYIIVRVKDTIRVIFKENFIGGEFRTLNAIIEVLQLIYNKEDFEVLLCNREIEVEK